MAPKKGLGKGLSALMGDVPTEEKKEGVMAVKINEIEPNKEQPRRRFGEEKLIQLSDSIKKHGVIQPLVVQKQEWGYQIIAGERRWRAARMAGLKEVPVVVKNFTPKEVLEISLIENLQREDLNPIEEATAYKKLIEEFSMSQEEVAERIGKSRPTITNALRLLQLDARVQELLIDEQITSGHARALLTLEDPEKQYELAKKVIEMNLSVRDVEQLVKGLKNQPAKKKENKMKDPVYMDIERRITDLIGSKVQIIKGRKKGKIEIEYYNDDDLERIMQLMYKIKQ